MSTDTLNHALLKLVVKRVNGDVMIYDPVENCYTKWRDLGDAKKRFIVSGYYAECLINGLNNVIYELEDTKLVSDDIEIINLLFTELTWFFRKAFIRSNAMGLPGRDGIKGFKELLDSLIPNNPHGNSKVNTSVEQSRRIKESELEEVELNRKREKSKKLFDHFEKYMVEDESGIPRLKPKYKNTKSTNTVHNSDRSDFYAPLDVHELERD